MDKLREAANDLINKIQSFVSEFIREEHALVTKAGELDKREEAVKARESAVSSVEVSETTTAEQKARKEELQKLQSDISRDFEDQERQQKAFDAEKEKWEKQKAADQKGIDNERADIRNQNAALAKDREEYKDKVLKKLKAEV